MDEINLTIGLFERYGDQVRHSWQIFITVNTAIFGWLITKKARHQGKVRVIASLAYLVFAATLFWSLTGYSALYHAAVEDLNRVLAAKPHLLTSLVREVNAFYESANNVIWYSIYWISALGVAGFVLGDFLTSGSRLTETPESD